MPARGRNARGADIDQAERLAKALDMRRAGATFQQIADECGWPSRANAYRAIRKAIDDIVREPANEIVTLELERLDAMHAALWNRAMAGPAKVQVAAVRQLINIMQRRAKLLGLDDFERRSIELAEKRRALDAAQARMVYEFINRVMNQASLTPEQRAVMPDIIKGELERISTTESAADDTK